MMHDIFKNHADHILDFIHTVEFLIPEVRIKSRRRTSRGLCNLCGDVYRVSFCLAIGNELADLASLVEKTAQVQGKRLDEYGNALSAFASFTQVTNAKLQSLSDIAEALNKRRMSIDEEAHRRAFQMTELIVLLADISAFHAATHELLQLEGTIQLLQHDFSSQNLLPYPQATTIIEEVTSHLADSNYLQVINTDPLSL
jgi:hypothetical protein